MNKTFIFLWMVILLLTGQINRAQEKNLIFPLKLMLNFAPTSKDKQDSLSVMINNKFRWLYQHKILIWDSLSEGPIPISIFRKNNLLYSGVIFHYDSTTVHTFPPEDNLNKALEEISVTGNMKEISRSESPVSVQVFNNSFFKKNPAPSLFESVQQISGVRPQVNCNICGTGDIHINGMEGPYTMVLIDGMPMISGLATVYGLMGIPRSMVQRMEIMKGPASSLYGSEAMGGIINVITRDPRLHSKMSLDYSITSWLEHNADAGTAYKLSSRIHALTGISSYYYQQRIDNNRDGFTDVPLQQRISFFQKVTVDGKKGNPLQMAFRYVWEDRWGGDVNWTRKFRGGDSIYGENILTRRWETFGTYRLPLQKDYRLWFSFNEHHQQSAYGTNIFDALQKNYFLQGYHLFSVKGTSEGLAGISCRYQYYDDNTPATETIENGNISNRPYVDMIPALFIQWEQTWTSSLKSLAGYRVDWHPVHGLIHSPRLAIKYRYGKTDFRISIGKGFRVVSIFTEDHAALTGARTVEIKSKLRSEESWNASSSLVRKIFTRKQVIEMEAGIFYTYFLNRIIPDYTTDVNKIIYDNISGFAENKGMFLNLQMMDASGWSLQGGIQYQENTRTENGKKYFQLLSERMSAAWNVSYEWKQPNIRFDYTGNSYGPMLLPVQGTNDPRPSESPWFSLHNFQITKTFHQKIELYTGIKNIFDWTPGKNLPFLIPRTNDPFDKKVVFGPDGKPLPTGDNPYSLVFDPSYVYAPNQGRRFFVGLRISL